MKSAVRVLALVLPLFLAACDSGSSVESSDAGGGIPPPDGRQPPPPVIDDLSGGAVVTLEAEGETFKVWIVSEETLALMKRALGSSIPGLTSVVRAGPGNSDHNQPWSWHLDPRSTFVADIPCAPCGGVLPSEVEANLDHYLSTYCMLQMAELQVTEFEDYR